MIRRLAAAIACAVVVAACARVLGLRRDPVVGQPFPHRAHVVDGIACVICHEGVADAGDSGPLHLPDDGTCARCHEPHTDGSCLDCHGDPFAVVAVDAARRHLRFAHADHEPASQGRCVTCHRGVAEGDRRLRPVMATCFRCHQDEQTDRDCDACHVDLEEEGTLPESHLVHDVGWIDDHGAYAGSAADLCGSCHTERSCAACHGKTVADLPTGLRVGGAGTESAHRAGFEARHAREARADPGMCSTCHAPSACEECHRARGVADVPDVREGSPHPPAWVVGGDHGRAARRDPMSCAACHGGAGEALCVSCHEVGGIGGNPHPPGWSSSQSLDELPCLLCHPGT